MRLLDLDIGSTLLTPREHNIAPIVGGAIVGGVSSLIGNIFGGRSQSSANDANREINQMNNEFNAQEAAKQRDWEEKMYHINNDYNSPDAMKARGLNPYMQGSGAMAASQRASGGTAAHSNPVPSMQAFRPDFSDVASSIASIAQARKMTSESNAIDSKLPYDIRFTQGATNFRNAAVGDSKYWNPTTGYRSALLDQSKEFQELRNMEFSGRLMNAQEAQIALNSQSQQVLNKYLDSQQQADLFIKGQTLANMYSQGALTDAKLKTEMYNAVKVAAEANGAHINNSILQRTADDLVRATNASNRYRFNETKIDNKLLKYNKKLDYEQRKYDSEYSRKRSNSYYIDRSVDNASKIAFGIGSLIGNFKR